jgi:hypothetical protein
MKKIISLALVLSILSSQAYAQAFTAPDILINTKLDSDWSGILVSRIRRVVKNFGYPDPFKQGFSQPIIVSKAKVQEYLNPSAKELLNDLGHMLNMDFLNGQTQVTIHGLHYDVTGFKTELSGSEEKIDGLSVSADFSASKVRVSADKVTLSLLIPGIHALPVINIDIINPVILASEDKLINFFAKIQLKDKTDSFKLFLEDANFANMSACLLEDQNAIKIDYERIVVPTVSVRIGNKLLKFDPKKIEALINSKKDGLKSILVAETASFLSSGMGEDVLKSINTVSFAKRMWIDSSSIQSMLNIDSFSNEPHGNIVEAKLSGDFCPHELYKIKGEACISDKVTKPVTSRITENHHLNSIGAMKSLIDQGNANIVVSISEDYVNKVLVSTYDAGLWDEMLKKAGVKMGPNKVFLRMDEKGSNTGTLYMDLLYGVKKIERMAIGAKEVRFPLVIKVGLKIKEDKRIPTFVIHMAGIDISDATLLNGIPELGVVSNVHTLRMKKKILASLREETAGLNNQDVLELRYPELRGLGLDKIDFVSDGNGRMNALILLQESQEKSNASLDLN